VSDQSPWGAPPPSNPPAQPPYQPPPAGGWAGGPPSYGVPLYPGPPGPQGPKKRTGLIVGIVAAVVLVVVALVVTLVVTSRGGDDPDEARSSDASPSESTSDEPTSTESSAETASEAPSSPSAPQPPGGDTITGDGYTYELPAAGWKDATDEADALDAATIDSVIVLGGSIQKSQSNIIVEALSAGGASSLEDLENLWKRNLSGEDRATPVDSDDIEIGGERAIGVTIDDRVNNDGDPIKQIAYLTLHQGQQYSIGLSFPASGDNVSKADFKAMLASWTWTS
jgi:hypothetical protein